MEKEYTGIRTATTTMEAGRETTSMDMVNTFTAMMDLTIQENGQTISLMDLVSIITTLESTMKDLMREATDMVMVSTTGQLDNTITVISTKDICMEVERYILEKDNTLETLTSTTIDCFELNRFS